MILASSDQEIKFYIYGEQNWKIENFLSIHCQ